MQVYLFQSEFAKLLPQKIPQIYSSTQTNFENVNIRDNKTAFNYLAHNMCVIDIKSKNKFWLQHRC